MRELSLFERLLSRTRYVGEVGLDGSQDHRETLDAQRGVFADVLRLCSRAGGKVLSLHSRGATTAVLDVLASEPTAGRAVLHWYVGSAKQVARAAEMGCWFSVGPSMLASKRGRAAASVMPRNRIVPESDGPFGVIEKRPAKPWDAWSVVPVLAELWRESNIDVARRLQSNFHALMAETHGLAQ